MAHEYYFSVNVDDDKGVPFGPVNKDNMDISRLIIDMTCWLDSGESITHIEHMLITINPATTPANTWRSDYPLNDTNYYSSGYMSDTYPLGFVSTSVIHEGKMIVIDLASGTPGFTYGVSFTATAGVSRRRRVIDVLVAIDQPLNSEMVGLATTPPSYTYPLIVNANTLLPYQFAGNVHIRNAVNAPITITLPPSPALGAIISFLDAGGTAATYPVTFVGDPSSSVFGGPWGYTRDDYVTSTNDFSLNFQWTGTLWYTDGPYLPVSGGEVSYIDTTGEINAGGGYKIDETNFALRVGGALRIFDSNNHVAMELHFGESLYTNAKHTFKNFENTVTWVLFQSDGTYNASGSWSVISDDSLKQNVVPYTVGLDAILALNPVSFEYISTSPLRAAGTTNYGLMASEVQTVLPEMVRSVDLDMDGVPDPVQTLSPTHLVYVLLNAVKELDARIQQLETAVGE